MRELVGFVFMVHDAHIGRERNRGIACRQLARMLPVAKAGGALEDAAEPLRRTLVTKRGRRLRYGCRQRETQQPTGSWSQRLNTEMCCVRTFARFCRLWLANMDVHADTER